LQLPRAGVAGRCSARWPTAGPVAFRAPLRRRYASLRHGRRVCVSCTRVVGSPALFCASPGSHKPDATTTCRLTRPSLRSPRAPAGRR
jgi:hypothetical protein